MRVAVLLEAKDHEHIQRVVNYKVLDLVHKARMGLRGRHVHVITHTHVRSKRV